MTSFVLSGAGWEPFKHWPIWRFLLEGLWISLQIAGYAIAISVVVGIVMAVARLSPSRPVRWLAATYIEVFRATPLLLLLLFIFFGASRVDLSWLKDIPFLDSIVDRSGHLDRMPAAIIALALYNSSVIAEVIRAGIVSIPRGIVEASRALGLSYLQSMRYVVLPTALRRMAPGLVSQLVTLYKDTSLASILSIAELLRRGRIIYDNPRYNDTIEVLIVVALMYFIPCYTLSLVSQRLEREPGRATIGAPPTALDLTTKVG